MAKIIKNLVVPYTAHQMYDLINTVSAYPEFMPWCKSTKIFFHTALESKATLYLFKGSKYSITTHNTMIPGHIIEMNYVSGPFSEFHGCWKFVVKHNYCHILFNIEYQFLNKIKQLLFEPIFYSIAHNFINHFYIRADKIYGKKNPN